MHDVESWGCPHDLLYVFNASTVVDDFASSIWSEHDHSAVAAAFVHRQNCAICVTDFKMDVHGATCSVGAVKDFLCGNRRCVIHWARGHNTSTPNRKKHLSCGPVKLQLMSASWLLTHLHG